MTGPPKSPSRLHAPPEAETHVLLWQVLSELKILSTEVKRLSKMSSATLAEIETLKADFTAEINAIGPAVNAAVAKALSDAGVDDTTAQTALTAIDQAVKDETATLVSMAAPAPAPGGDTTTGSASA